MEASTSKRSTAKSGSAKDTAEGVDYEAAVDQGYIGVMVDTAPNEDYTVAGVVARAEEGPPNVVQEGDPEHAEPAPS
jgi:hypothetical protein